MVLSRSSLSYPPFQNLGLHLWVRLRIWRYRGDYVNILPIDLIDITLRTLTSGQVRLCLVEVTLTKPGISIRSVAFTVPSVALAGPLETDANQDDSYYESNASWF